jgi:hypothetical protein
MPKQGVYLFSEKGAFLYVGKIEQDSLTLRTPL